MQHDVHPMNGARREWSTISTAGAQQVSVEVVDVDGGQLVHRQMAEQRLEMMLDDAAGLTQRRGRPRRRRMRQPAVEQIGDRAGAKPGVAGLLDELGEPSGGVAP